MRKVVERIRGIQDIVVYDTDELFGERGRFRVMTFSDDAVQGAMDLDRPERIVLEYPRAMLHLMECSDPGYEDVFVIGHGAGTLPGRLPSGGLRIAELDPDVVTVSENYFGYRGTPPIVGDGLELLERTASSSLDFLVVDAFTADGVPERLVSEELFRVAREKLDDRGAVLLNITGRGMRDRRVGVVFSALRDRFAYTEAFVLPSPGAADPRNVLLVGSGAPIKYRANGMAGFVVFDPLSL